MPAPAFTLQQGSPVGPSQSARYNLANKVEKVVGLFDAYGQLQNISTFSPAVASTLVSVPYGSIPVAAARTVQALVEVSFSAADIASTFLSRIANNIKN
jgi:hypothetical protein